MKLKFFNYSLIGFLLSSVFILASETASGYEVRKELVQVSNLIFEIQVQQTVENVIQL
jgi:hypothetical protein